MSKNSIAFHGNLDAEGYSKEEEYFYKLNKELLEEHRKKLDQARTARKKEAHTAAHWMKCPKCGSTLQETNLLGICMDECAGCHGVFLDRGELSTLLEAKEPHTFLNKLKQIFKMRDDSPIIF